MSTDSGYQYFSEFPEYALSKFFYFVHDLFLYQNGRNYCHRQRIRHEVSQVTPITLCNADHSALSHAAPETPERRSSQGRNEQSFVSLTQ